MIHVELAAVTDVLAAMGLDRDGLVEAITRGQNARNLATQNHPPTAKGLFAWFETVRALRDIFMPKGADRNDAFNVSRLVCGQGDSDVVVATGNKNTGNADPNADPQPKYAKGPAVKSIVALNQLELFKNIAAEQEKQGKQKRKTWFLLVHRSGDEVSAELSLPRAMTKDGYVKSWDARIILGKFAVEPGPAFDSGDDFIDEIDIDVSKK